MDYSSRFRGQAVHHYASVSFRKIAPGLYGTGLFQKTHGDFDPGFPGDADEAELVIDRMDGWWWEREALFYGNGHYLLTGWLGEGWRTLGEAKQAISDMAERRGFL